ncbi:hypothetical protein BJX66DRAFT_301097 [Aspergillus keveii]|uniref:Uncharacterized protein n=1 Tax=Aspergillus keveii TaxID=714993 RepID=A0ABR4GA48_9EURO
MQRIYTNQRTSAVSLALLPRKGPWASFSCLFWVSLFPRRSIQPQQFQTLGCYPIPLAIFLLARTSFSGASGSISPVVNLISSRRDLLLLTSPATWSTLALAQTGTDAPSLPLRAHWLGCCWLDAKFA